MESVSGGAGFWRQVEAFERVLRESCLQTHPGWQISELSRLGLENPAVVPAVFRRLPTTDPNFERIRAFLLRYGPAFYANTEDYLHLCALESPDTLSNDMYRFRQAQLAGREPAFIADATSALGKAETPCDRWDVLRALVFCLNNFGHYYRAQICALSAYQIAEWLDEEAMLQRSQFSVLNSSRLARNSDLGTQYLRHFRALKKGELLYSDYDQALVPLYAATHLMDAGGDSGEVYPLLCESDDMILDEFTRHNNRLAWVYYDVSVGHSKRARRALREEMERYAPQTRDMAAARLLGKLCLRLGVEIGPDLMPVFERASQAEWQRFDGALDHFVAANNRRASRCASP